MAILDLRERISTVDIDIGTCTIWMRRVPLCLRAGRGGDRICPAKLDILPGTAERCRASWRPLRCPTGSRESHPIYPPKQRSAGQETQGRRIQAIDGRGSEAHRRHRRRCVRGPHSIVDVAQSPSAERSTIQTFSVMGNETRLVRTSAGDSAMRSSKLR